MHQVQSYLGNPNVKRDGVVQEWTPDLVDEYSKCMKDPSYFAEKYWQKDLKGVKAGGLVGLGISWGR